MLIENMILCRCLKHFIGSQSNIEYHLSLLLYVYKINGLGPIYLSNCLQIYVPKRNLRSTDDILCLQYPISRVLDGDRTFTVFASKLWNNLPVQHQNNLRQYKKQSPSIHSFPQGSQDIILFPQ